MDMTSGFDLWTFDLTNVQSTKFYVTDILYDRYRYFQISLENENVIK